MKVRFTRCALAMLLILASQGAQAENGYQWSAPSWNIPWLETPISVCSQIINIIAATPAPSCPTPYVYGPPALSSGYPGVICIVSFTGGLRNRQ
jgi:hypothetical protein